MRLEELISGAKRPELYTGGSLMWSDPHIQGQLLEIHLNSEIDLASRKESSIEKTIEWILSNTEKKKLKLLDLGCGPGLYTSRFAALGYEVSGIDISQTSIDYAQQKALEDGLDISYKHGSYLELDIGDSQWDLIIMIYTDFGVLTPEERKLLLAKIHRALKPGGRFIFDLLNDSAFEDLLPEKSWEAEEAGGFWAPGPYLHLSESFIYEEEGLILYRHLVADSRHQVKTYNFWTHFFSDQDIKEMLEAGNFRIYTMTDDVLPAGGQWNGKSVTFTVCTRG